MKSLKQIIQDRVEKLEEKRALLTEAVEKNEKDLQDARAHLENFRAEEDEEKTGLSQEVLIEAISQALEEEREVSFFKVSELRNSVRKKLKELTPGIRLKGFPQVFEEAARKCNLLRSENGGYRVVRSEART